MNEITPIDASRQPVVRIRDGEVFANSRDVATFFDKRHDNTLRDIDNLLASGGSSNLRNLFIERHEYHEQARKDVRTFDMTRDGFSLLAMGFTGEKALKFKLAYIAQFNAMEAELRRAPAIPDLNDPKVLLGLLTEHTAKRIEAEQRAAIAEQRVEAAKPKTVFYDQFANADGLYTLQNGGRVLNLGANKFIGMLKAGYLFYQGGALVPRAVFRDQGLFEVKVTIVDDRSRAQTFLTPKGIQYFAKKFGKTGQIEMALPNASS